MTKLFLVLFVSAAVIGLFCFRSQQRAQRERLQATQEVLEETAARAEQAERRGETFKRELVKLQAEQLSKPVTISLPLASPVKSAEHPAAKLFRDPEMRTSMRKQHVKAVQQTVSRIVDSNLIHHLNLTPEQSLALKELVQKKHAPGVDLVMALMSGDASELSAIGHAAQRQRNQADAEIRSFLGEQGYDVYADYEDSLPERQRVSEFRRKFDDAGFALSADQESALVQAMVEERQNFKFTSDFHDPLGFDMDRLPEIFGEESLDQFISEMEQLNNRIILRAQSLLSPEQSGEFAQALRDHFEKSKMTVKMTNALFPVGRKN